MDLYKDKYIIVEIIPTWSTKDKGFIAQISALKLEGLKLLDRFDYRVDDKLIENEDLKKFIKYDKNMFTYVDNKYFIPEKFKQFVEDLPLMIIEDKYTLDYLDYLDNKKELVFKYLNLDYSLDVFNILKKKYSLEDSNHLVDLVYEAIIYESNNKGFTMVELIVSIAILGLIFGMSFPIINNIRTNNTNEEFIDYGDALISSSKIYVDSYYEDMFYDSDKYTLTFEELNNKGLVKDIGIDNTSCSSSKVIIIKTSSSYKYCINMKCTNKNDKVIYSYKNNNGICKNV